MPYKSSKSRIWYASFTDGRGRRVRRSTGTESRKEAAALEAKWKAEAHQERHWDRPPALPVEHVLAYFLDATESAKRSAAQDKSRAITLTQSLPGIDAYGLRPGHVRAHIADRQAAGIADNSINRELALLSAAINFYNREEDVLIPNPVRGRRLPEPAGRTRWLTPDEAARLIHAAEQTRSRWLADYIRLALHTGMRTNEILGLEWTRVDFGSGLIHLGEEHTKSRKARAIPILPDARAVLRSRWQQRGQGSSFVFCRGDGSRIRRNSGSWHRACALAGIEDLRPHDLRHTFASWLVQRGTSMAVVAALLGHASITMTQRYAHLGQQDLRVAMENLSGVLSEIGHTASGCADDAATTG